jgi:queuine/archaeosine tRNA-ribosyltransferase
MHRVAGDSHDDARAAMERSTRWARRARVRMLALRDEPGAILMTNPGQAQFGIVQGGIYRICGRRACRPP